MSEIVVFGGGCFWCTEAIFQQLKGILAVASGYAGGEPANPTYYQVSSGATGHAEVIKIDYDPEKISFKDLLTVFFSTHDPTTVNRQGADVGTQYRSIILYTTDAQRQQAKDYIAELNDSSAQGNSIVTEVVPLTTFYAAELEHQQFYENNPQQSYSQAVINPKLEKVRSVFKELMKEQL